MDFVRVVFNLIELKSVVFVFRFQVTKLVLYTVSGGPNSTVGAALMRSNDATPKCSVIRNVVGPSAVGTLQHVNAVG